jgi:cation:H+ antiporter
MAYWFLGGGLVLLLFGSDAIVRGGVAITRVLNLSPLVIGLLVITAGTSAPEFAVSLQAAESGLPDIALANVIGSNILNLLLILGLAAVIRPLPSSPKVVLRDGGAMLIAATALAIMSRGSGITRIDGLMMLGAFALYIAAIFFSDWRRSAEHSVPCARAAQHLQNGAPSGAAGVFLLLFGFVGLTVGAHFTVAGAQAVAREFHLSQATIGLTAVAFGASVPELVVTLVAAVRRQTHLAIGHLIGSNVFNVLGALGATAAIVPLKVNPALQGDLLAMGAASALIVPLLISRWRLSRPRGALLVLSYACYLLFVAWRQGLVAPSMIGLG